MNNVQIGSLVLNGQLILYLAFGAAGWLILRYRLRNMPERHTVLSVLSNAYLMWILVWKFSFLLFHPMEVFHRPAALLYFDGGARGVWIASLVSALYIWKNAARLKRVLPISAIWSSIRHLILRFRALKLEVRRNIIVLLFMISLAGYGIYDYLDKSPSKATQTAVAEVKEVGVRKGQRAPDFTLANLEGHSMKLSDYRGKRVLLNFWATCCPPCQVEMPHMQKFYEDYQQQDVVILGVNMTSIERHQDDTQNFVSKGQFTFPILLDPEGDVMQTYQVTAYPTTYLLDSSGVIKDKFVGAMSYEVMKKYVAELE